MYMNLMTLVVYLKVFDQHFLNFVIYNFLWFNFRKKIILIAIAIVIITSSTRFSDNKNITKKEKTDNDDFEDFIIFNMINKHK